MSIIKGNILEYELRLVTFILGRHILLISDMKGGSNMYWTEGKRLRDHGPNPYVTDIELATKQNTNFRTALWTGKYLQLTLMSIRPKEDIGLEIHYDHDQFIRIEEGQGIVLMGNSKSCLDYKRRFYDDYVIFIPAGKWHNLINTGRIPLKLYSIYAPPEHPHGTIHKRKEDEGIYNRY